MHTHDGNLSIPEAAYHHEFIRENIPQELQDRPQWVVWKLGLRDGKLTKIPYTPSTGLMASSTNLMTWAAFPEALKALETGRYDGVGFVFCSADPYTGVDLDKVVNPETGEIKPQAREVMDMLDGYQELSVSGTGVHIIVRGRIPSSYKNRAEGWIEVYSQDRFFTMSGRVI